MHPPSHGLRTSVVVRELDMVGALGGPCEADPVLIIDPDRILARAVTLELFELVSRRRLQIRERECCIQIPELPAHNGPDRVCGSILPGLPSGEDVSRRLVLEALDHARNLYVIHITC